MTDADDAIDARAACAATSTSTTSASSTRPARRCCTGSTSTCRPGRPSRSSATPAPASRRSRSCSRASTTRPTARSRSTAPTCAPCARSRCAASSGSSRRRASSSPARSPTTSPSAGPTRRREEIVAAARTVGADEFIERLEDGYDTQLGERGFRLSLGQRQLVAFSRALLADPRILILDEATSSVDIGTERRIERALRRLLHGRTAFIIAHRLSTIRDAEPASSCSSTATIVEQGTHDELLARARPLRRALRHAGPPRPTSRSARQASTIARR